jgi:hypothetical protein
MTITLSGLARSMLLVSAFIVASLLLSSVNLGFEEALANNAGGNGNGKGQGAANAGTNGGGNGASAASAGGLAKGQNYDVNGRLNGLVKASSVAWNNPNSQIGKMALALTAAFEGYLSATSTDPAAPLPTDLVSILAIISNKELTQADLDAIEARVAQENPDNLLLQSLADPSLETTNLQLQTTLQNVDQTLIDAVNAEVELNQGLGELGPIY